MKKLLTILIYIVSVNAFAAISEQNKLNFQYKYGGEINPQTSTKMIDACDKNNTDMESCLKGMKAQQTNQQSVQSKQGYRYCCYNVSGQWGEHAYIYGNDLCVPPC